MASLLMGGVSGTVSAAERVAAPARIRLGPAEPMQIAVEDASGRGVATVAVRSDEATVLELPPGSYRLRSIEGTWSRRVDAPEGGEVTVDLPAGADLSPIDVPAPDAVDLQAPIPPELNTPSNGPRPPASKARWVAPLVSALVPGAGQLVNRQPGKGVGVLAGIIGAIVGTWATVRADDPTEGAAFDDQGRPAAAEVARLVGLVTFTDALGLLYVGQILDAHAVARGRPADPVTDYKVAVTFNRSSAIGLSPGEPAYALYDDYTLSLMGQVFPRITVGLSDLSFKLGNRPSGWTMQGGVATMARFLEVRRLWLSAGGGVLMQGTRAVVPPPLALPRDVDEGELERRFGAAIYLQGQLQLFLLDRWSLHLQPRVSLPLTDRVYARGRTIPRLSTTFELGAGVGVHF